MNIVIFVKYKANKATNEDYYEARSPISKKAVTMSHDLHFTGLENHRHAARYYAECHGYKIMREVYAAKQGTAWLAEKPW